jgi:hypothetical protein
MINVTSDGPQICLVLGQRQCRCVGQSYAANGRVQMVRERDLGEPGVRWRHRGMEGDELDRRSWKPVWGIYLQLADHACMPSLLLAREFPAHFSPSLLMQTPRPSPLESVSLVSKPCVNSPLRALIGGIGRPWNALATTVYLNTNMDASIQPTGWTNFSTTSCAACPTGQPYVLILRFQPHNKHNILRRV